MKVTFLTIALFVVLLASGRAVDVVTPEEKYFDVKVTKVEAEGVRISHREGAAYVDFDFLPPAMQLEHGWTPEKSAARKAAREAEAKRIADEERMAEEEPKRKAAEAAAKERAIKEKETGEALARAKIDGVAAQKDLMEEAAKARAEIDRDRARAKGGAKPDAIPVAEPIVERTAPDRSPDRSPNSTKNAVLPAGSVAALLEEEKPSGLNRNVGIALGVASVIVVLLFFMASGKDKVKVRVPPGTARRRR